MTSSNQPDPPNDYAASSGPLGAGHLGPEPLDAARIRFYLEKADRYQQHGPGAHLRKYKEDIAREFGIASIVHSGLIGPLEAHNLVAFHVVPAAFAKDAEAVTRARGRFAAIVYLADHAGSASLGRPTLATLHSILTQDLPIPKKRRRKSPPPIGTGEGSRDADVDEMLAAARAMESPVDASLFVLSGLLRTAPFDSEREGLAIIAASIPLIQANLPPLSFVRTPPKRLAQAFRSASRLGRTERLREVFLAACEQAGLPSNEEALALRLSLFGARGLGRSKRQGEVDPAFVERYAELFFGIEAGALKGKGAPDVDMLRVLAGELVARKDRRMFVRVALARVDALVKEKTEGKRRP
jgi:hypothetical protein